MNQNDQMREALWLALNALIKAGTTDEDDYRRQGDAIHACQQALAHVNETPKIEHDSDDVLKPASHIPRIGKMVRPSDEKIWALWHELPNPQGNYAIARFAEEIMDEMERLNK